MKSRRWVCGSLAAMVALAGVNVFAQGHGNHGEGNGHGRGHNRDEDEGGHYSKHDRDEARGWYHGHRDGLPPGLAKRDQLPPGLERQLRVRGTLPPGLRDRIRPCPPELVRVLPPPPPNCEHVFIGGHVVLLNRRTFMVLDIVHFER